MALGQRLAMLIGCAGLAACAQGNGPSDIATGSIGAALPTMPSLSSAGSLIPGLGTASGPRRPERVSGNLYRVHTADRKIDDAVQRDNYSLLRAAEGAKEVGGTHFIVADGAQVRPDVGGASASGAPDTTLIRVLRLDSDIQPPVGAISADEIIHFFGPNFGRTADKRS
jgi:hypothetical protein